MRLVDEVQAKTETIYQRLKINPQIRMIIESQKHEPNLTSKVTGQ
jgi:hypothetical protein